MLKSIKIIGLIMAGMCLLTGFVTNATASADILVESDHSYANNFDYTWPAISQPGTTQIRLHFVKLGLPYEYGEYPDRLIFSDKDGNELLTYNSRNNGDDFWTDWYAGDTIKVRLITTAAGTAYGFKIDQVETRPNTGSTPTVQPEFTPTETNETSSLVTVQPTNVTPVENNTAAPVVALNTNTSEANYTIPSQNNPSYGSCGNSICEGPTVSFYANVTSGTAPLKVVFTSSTTGNPSSYFWVFKPTYSSDWNSKHAVTALHTFQNPGVYTVSLTVNNAAGSSTFTRNNYITVY